ncbi:MAG: right-handed parallel beta-helix repeat-containing protein [Phycisphaerae bacterium]|jgi:hypothetical protein
MPTCIGFWTATSRAWLRIGVFEGLVAHDSAGDNDGTLVSSPAWAPFGGDCNGNGVLDECETIVDGAIYVDDDATGGLNDGLSWANAFVDLQDALACATCDSRVTEIRVAEGTYKPGWDESHSFHMVNGVALRGGYRGLAGGGDPDDRDIDAFESILSGDVRVTGDPDDNCRHVVVCETVDESTVIEGFTITEGNASGQGEGDEYGGGMFIAEDAGPTIARCKFVANRADSGGGIYNDFGRPTLTGCTFSGNSANWGGAMYGGGLLANPVTIANCTFSGNSADGMGGGVFFASGTIKLTNCTFSGNAAGTHGGAAAVDHRSLSMTFANCTFSGNSAGTLGGVLFSILNSYSSIHAVNCVLWGNTAPVNPQLDSGADVSFSCVQGSYAGSGNIDADPLFVDADGPDGIYGTADDNLRLLEGSPCINTGDDESIPAGVTIDLDGEPRVQHCHVDMGAYETPYFDEDCNSNDVSDECDIENCDGSPWCGDCNENGVPDECDIADGTAQDCNENGIPDECEPGWLEDCNENGVPDFCDLFGGTSQDCNDNSVPDECDIASGTSQDCNENGIPDECDIDNCDGSSWCGDCNDNGVPDGCDVAIGTSQDCNENGIPDECDIENCDGSPWCGDCNNNSVPDECDIASGTAQDCNANGIPDECEPGGTEDCNANGISDLCDLHTGTSPDCNGNGVPDECETLVSGVIYVDDDAAGGLNDGSSWADAFVDLQEALAYSKCSGLVSEIRVAGGTYFPGTSPHNSIYLQNGVALRGGYRGLASGGDPDDRDIGAFESILSGDIGVVGNPGDNSRSVVDGGDTDASAVLEGFTITEGHANFYGGGMYIPNGSPTIVRCTISANSAGMAGGGVWLSSGSPTIRDCTISANSAGYGGAGMYSGGSSPTLTNCTFSGNSADYGGGMLNEGLYNLALTNCTFSGNSASRGGGLFNDSGSSGVTVTGCTFSGNSASNYGGGIADLSDDSAVVNCVVWGNTSPQDPQIRGSDGHLVVTYSCVQGGWEGDGNIDADPLFVDADGPDDVFGTEDDDLHLLEGSPCINAGDNAAIPSGVTTDFEGEDRVQQCRVDMGADETPYFEDCNSNDVADACDIADCDGSPWCGDCNGNGVPDECDIASGTSEDLNGNGVPDECEIFGDCDHDLDVDLDDLEAMLGCLFGPDETPSEGCDCADINADLDVDLADFALFQQQFTGPLP